MTDTLTRRSECVDCHASIDQELVGEFWVPLRCHSCDLVMQRKATARTEFLEKAQTEHLRRNALSTANVRSEIADGRLTLDKLAALYTETRINGGVPIYRYTEIVSLVKDFVSVPPLLRGGGMASILILCGDPGTGKTWLLEAAIGYVARELCRTAIFTSPLKMWADIKAARGFDDVTEARTISDLTGCAVLGIDDIARKPSPTEWEVAMLLQVIDERYRMNRPTLISSNYDAIELFKLWSDQGDERKTKNVRLLCDRLSDRKAAISLSLNGRSLRREGVRAEIGVDPKGAA